MRKNPKLRAVSRLQNSYIQAKITPRYANEHPGVS
jgi:hypothetical protein